MRPLALQQRRVGSAAPQRPGRTAARFYARGNYSKAGSNGAPDGAALQPAAQPDAARTGAEAAAGKPRDVLNLAFESDKKLAVPKPVMETVVKTTGLHRAPLSGGVKTATTRCE